MGPEPGHGSRRREGRGPPTGTRRGQGGSVLLLLPAAVLAVLVMAAITVDAAVAFLAQREVANAAAAAANDAATLGLSQAEFYGGGQVALDAGAVQAVAVAEVRAALDAGRHRDLTVTADVVPPTGPGCPWSVTVRASSEVDYVFAPIVPGAAEQAQVSATARSQPQQGLGGC